MDLLGQAQSSPRELSFLVDLENVHGPQGIGRDSARAALPFPSSPELQARSELLG
jgi:hypothetical protein